MAIFSLLARLCTSVVFPSIPDQLAALDLLVANPSGVVSLSVSLFLHLELHLGDHLLHTAQLSLLLL